MLAVTAGRVLLSSPASSTIYASVCAALPVTSDLLAQVARPRWAVAGEGTQGRRTADAAQTSFTTLKEEAELKVELVLAYN